MENIEGRKMGHRRSKASRMRKAEDRVVFERGQRVAQEQLKQWKEEQREESQSSQDT
jgi:hypothetical protein